jgi:hypothetical protein
MKGDGTMAAGYSVSFRFRGSGLFSRRLHALFWARTGLLLSGVPIPWYPAALTHPGVARR